MSTVYRYKEKAATTAFLTSEQPELGGLVIVAAVHVAAVQPGRDLVHLGQSQVSIAVT